MKLKLDKPTKMWAASSKADGSIQVGCYPYIFDHKRDAWVCGDEVLIPVLVTVTRIPKRKAVPRG